MTDRPNEMIDALWVQKAITSDFQEASNDAAFSAKVMDQITKSHSSHRLEINLMPLRGGIIGLGYLLAACLSFWIMRDGSTVYLIEIVSAIPIGSNGLQVSFFEGFLMLALTISLLMSVGLDSLDAS